MPFGVVAIVLDETCGDRLNEMAARGPVWAIDSAANRRAASLQTRDGAHPVALCTFPRAGLPEERLLEMVRSIVDCDDEAEAGTFPCPILTVVGFAPTDTAGAALREYGLTSLTRTADGFVATRPPP